MTGRECLVGKLSSVPRISCSSPEIISISCSTPKITSTSVLFVIFAVVFTNCEIFRDTISIMLSRPGWLKSSNGLHLRLTANLARFRELILLKT